MLRNGDISPIAVKRAVRGYWWVPVVSSVALGAIAVVAVWVLPKKYTSRTAVLVEEPTVPQEYVKPVVTEDVYHRLASMQGQILSDTRLVPVVEKLGLASQEHSDASVQKLVGQLRDSVKISPLPPTPGMEGRGPLPGFYLSVTYNDPTMAQKICSEVSAMFLEQNVLRRVTAGEETTRFLSQELDDAKQRLDVEDQKLAQFKRQYLGALPEEEQGNLNILTSLNTQLEANTQSLSRAQQDKAFNETVLSQQMENWKATLSGQKSTESMEQQLASLQGQMDILLTKYTPEHPDVVKLQTQISELKQRMAQAAANANSGSAPVVPAPTAPLREPPYIQQLRAKIHQDELNIADLTRRQNQIQDQIRQTQGRVQASPMVELQMKELTRNYQTALDFYHDLLKKRENSSMATNLEHEQESEQFRVLDPPNFPSKPSFPDPLKFDLAGFGGGFALGLACIGLIAYRDKRLYTDQDVENTLKLPVLVTIPSFNVSKVAGASARTARVA